MLYELEEEELDQCWRSWNGGWRMRSWISGGVEIWEERNCQFD